MKAWTTGLIMGAMALGAVGALAQDPGGDPIIESIGKLEGARDPKCYATASRLEDFMFGTPLTAEARFAKNLLQKGWAKAVWAEASRTARGAGETDVDEGAVRAAVRRYYTVETGAGGDRLLRFPEGEAARLGATDVRQYGTVAYALRALLAVQQESMLDPGSDLLPLTPEAVDAIKEGLDLFTLAVLQRCDAQARAANRYEVDVDSLEAAWAAMLPPERSAEGVEAGPERAAVAAGSHDLLKAIAAQKVASYEAYNQINNQLFVRNLQVYFAKSSWPKDPAEGKRFKDLFGDIMVGFAGDLCREAESRAAERGHPVVMERDVHDAAQALLPHALNQYEDATFFPRLPRGEQVTLEAYDMDSFRDSGLHWNYLLWSLEDAERPLRLQPDPFAAELLVENIAQFGTLVLRMAGDEARREDKERLATAHLAAALDRIRDRAARDARMPAPPGRSDRLASAPEAAHAAVGTYFTDITAAAGVSVLHRSADWLNRLLRSYLKKDETTGVITIPPAFGGAGIAAEDINGDGLPDLLILSGLGNRLYANRGKGRFEDITAAAGLDWRRPDGNLPGEPRQPIIADLDNDGRRDIVITYVDDAHRVYRNLGDERFEDVTARAGLGGKGLVGGPATVFDFDNDGLLDLYITYFGDYLHGVLPTLKRRNDNGLPNRLFRNLGGFRFQDVTAGSGTADTGWGQAVTHTDLDGDGRQDLIVGNDFGVNSYYRNLGGGKFADIAGGLGTDKPSYTMGIGVADLNADGFPDFYISNIVTMNKDEKYVLPGEETRMKFNPDKLARMRVVEANDLFLSMPGPEGLRYTPSRAVGRGYSSTGWAWDADFFDFDNDGDEDLYVLNGMNEYNLYSSENPYYADPVENQAMSVVMPVAEKESNVFFVNEGGILQNASAASGAALLGNSRSAAYLDLDGDGDLDMALNNYHGEAVVYRNNSERTGNHWLEVRLEGDPARGSNRDAVGARILARIPGGLTVWREVRGTTGYMSVHPKAQHIGLGRAETADLEVTWPNGERTVLRGVQADRPVFLKQGDAPKGE